MSDDAVAAMTALAAYSNLEFDLDSGGRQRYGRMSMTFVCRVTGAEAAMAVNNNASALLLVLIALATTRDVVISRGQPVEIGGAFGYQT